MHVEIVAKKELIEREKVEFPFKKERGEGNKGEKKKVGAKSPPKSPLWLKCGKRKRKKSIC